MALFNEDGQEKTEAPSARRRQESRDDGKVPTSQEMNSVVLLLAGLGFLGIGGREMISGMMQLTEFILRRIGQTDISVDTIAAAAPLLGIWILKIIGPFMGTLCITAIVVNILQHGFILSWKPLMPKTNFPGLNPLKGVKEAFSLRSVMRFVFNVVKLIIVARAAFFTLRQAWPEIMDLADMPVPAISMFWVDIFFRLLSKLYIYLLLIALIDYGYQRWEFERNLKMTKQEVKDEMKQMNGDPKIKAKIRSAQMQLARKRMMQDVPEADVVITNPVHYAVAVKYAVGDMSAPRVVAKGARLLAQRIKEVAMAHQVPVVENVELARALYRSVEVGGDVPAQLYQAVAEVLAYVYQINKRRYQSLWEGMSKSRR